ncbi:MAG: hypothetical protein ACFFCQ_15900 [Promethearchaeota archaeon]
MSDQLSEPRISTFLNRYCRSYGYVLMLLLPILVLIMLMVGKFNPLKKPWVIEIDDDKGINTFIFIAAILYTCLAINSLLFALNAFLLIRGFKNTIKTMTKSGLPVDSVQGFRETNTGINNSFLNSILIVIMTALSYLIFIGFAIYWIYYDLIEENLNIDESKLRMNLIILSFALALVAIGITTLIRVPKKPAFHPGGLIGFYKPTRIPVILDNFLTDSTLAYLDPATRLRFDEWTNAIRTNLKEDYEAGYDLTTRTERAREKILLLTYLMERFPSVMTKIIYKKELKEIILHEKVEDFLATGIGSGISADILTKLTKQLIKEIPEIFETVDQIIVALLEDLRDFKEKDLFVSIGCPSNHIGTSKPFRVLTFVLNKSPEFKDKRRPVKINLVTAKENMIPSDISCYLSLDESEGSEIRSDKLDIVSDKEEDVAGVLATLLQIGDAWWVQIQANTFGQKLVTVTIEEGEKGVIFGMSQSVTVGRDLSFYLIISV